MSKTPKEPKAPKVPKEPKAPKASKQPKQPQFFKNDLGFDVYNYQVYYFKRGEGLITALLAFIVGGLVGYIFYGGLFKDSITHLDTTLTHISDSILVSVVGIITAIAFLPVRRKQLLEKNQLEIRNGFRSLLDSLVASISSGLNSVSAFEQAKTDLIEQFGADARIAQEVDLIVVGFNNGKTIEFMLADFAKRTNDADILSFSDIFEIANSKGGNLGAAIKAAQTILNEKVEIASEIKTAISSNKTESYVMVVIPILMILLIKFNNPAMALGYTNLNGVIAVTVSIVMYVVAFLIASRMTRIKI